MDTDKDKITQYFPDDQDYSNDLLEKNLETDEFLLDTLRRSTDKGFSLGFTNHIIKKIAAKQHRRFMRKLYAVFSLLVLIGLGFSSLLFDQEQVTVMFSMFAEYKFIILFILMIVGFVQIISHSFQSKNLGN